MSKISRETYENAIKNILADSHGERKRNFRETVELQVMLKAYDPQKDKRFSGTVKLPHVAKDNLKVCILGDQKHIDEANALGIPSMDLDSLKKFKKDKKQVKKLGKSYDAFLASPTVIKMIPRVLGPGLNKMGKFPTLLTHDDNIEEKIAEMKATIRFQMKKVMTLGVAIGNVEMSEDDLVTNAHMSTNFLVSLLKKHWQNVRSLNLKSTMGRPQRIY
jgi:large subunit ribosomal protein L10Ae